MVSLKHKELWMLSVLLFLWQLPQNLLGLLVIWITDARYNDIFLSKRDNFWCTYRFGTFGVSLGEYVIFGRGGVSAESLQHEQGHQKQSRYLGPLYLIIVGLPSLLGNIYDRLFHRHWEVSRRVAWYYSLPWEAWADRLGGVLRR